MIQNLIPDNLHHLKGLHGSYRIHEHISMDSNEVFRVEDAVFVLDIHEIPSAANSWKCIFKHVIPAKEKQKSTKLVDLPGQRYQ